MATEVARVARVIAARLLLVAISMAGLDLHYTIINGQIMIIKVMNDLCKRAKNQT